MAIDVHSDGTVTRHWKMFQIKYGIARYLLVLTVKENSNSRPRSSVTGAGHLALAIRLLSVSPRSSCARPILSFHKPLVAE